MKQKRLKTQRYDSEDTKEIRNLIIIAVILIALAVGLYFLTDTILSKKKVFNAQLSILLILLNTEVN